MGEHVVPFTTTQISPICEEFAPDGSEIRFIGRNRYASAAHGTLPPGCVSSAVRHQTIEEIWFVLSGQAEIWRRLGDQEAVVRASAGTSLTIPLGTHFQFRTVGDEPFCFIMFTTPAWPGDDEAIRVPDYWSTGR